MLGKPLVALIAAVQGVVAVNAVAVAFVVESTVPASPHGASVAPAFDRRSSLVVVLAVGDDDGDGNVVVVMWWCGLSRCRVYPFAFSLRLWRMWSLSH